MVYANAERLLGGDVFFDMVTVGGTINVIDVYKRQHEALAEGHNLAVALALGVEVAAALAAADGQAGEGVFEDLLKAQELDDALIDLSLIHILVISLVLAVIVKLVLDLYFKTKSGLLLRAVGDNASLVTSLARDKGSVKILGLMISNALVALGGCLVCHETRSFSATMGTGQLVFGLAAVIIGVSLFRFYGATGLAQALRRCRPLRFLGSPRDTTAVIVGSFLYKACIQIAMSLGLPTNMLKLVTAVLFLLVLVVSGRKGEEIIHA